MGCGGRGRKDGVLHVQAKLHGRDKATRGGAVWAEARQGGWLGDTGGTRARGRVVMGGAGEGLYAQGGQWVGEFRPTDVVRDVN